MTSPRLANETAIVYGGGGAIGGATARVSRTATLLGRLPMLQQVAECAAFVASERAGAVTGAIMLFIAERHGLLPSDPAARVPVIDANRRRCESRPAFQRALAAQLAAFARHIPD